MKITRIIFSLGILFTLSACYYDNEEELYPTATSNCDTTNLTYANGIKTIIDTRCSGSSCHVSGTTSPDLSTYQGLVNNIARVKVRAIDEKSMPAAAPLSACEIKKLTTWINAGTPQ